MHSPKWAGKWALEAQSMPAHFGRRLKVCPPTLGFSSKWAAKVENFWPQFARKWAAGSPVCAKVGDPVGGHSSQWATQWAAQLPLSRPKLQGNLDRSRVRVTEPLLMPCAGDIHHTRAHSYACCL